MTSETESLLYDCRAALLQHSDEQLAALFACWFEFLIDDQSMEEVLDDLLLLLGYRMRSWGTKISYASYTAWWEVEGYLAPEGGVFDCADAGKLRRRLLRIPIEQFGRVMELIYHVRLVAAQLHGESGLPGAMRCCVSLQRGSRMSHQDRRASSKGHRCLRTGLPKQKRNGVCESGRWSHRLGSVDISSSTQVPPPE